MKRLQDLNLEDDFLFAKVMSDAEICKEVLKEILEIDIKRVEMPASQKAIDLMLDCKAIRLDIYVNDEEGTVYNVEMQKAPNKNLGKRSRYYQGNIDLDLISKGEDYRKLRKSFVIFICCFDPYGEKRHRYTFKTTCCEDKELILDDEVTKVFLSTKGERDDVSETLKEFLKYVEHTTSGYAEKAKSQLVKRLQKKVDEVKHNPKLEVEWMTLLERDREKFEEGVEKGIEQGIEQGIEKGIEKGRQETQREVARNLLTCGVDVEMIEKATGLSKEEIEKLR